MLKKKIVKCKKKKEVFDVIVFIIVGVDVFRFVGCDKDDLMKWFNVYLGIEFFEGSYIYCVKVGDVEWFLKFFYQDFGGYYCDDWMFG